MLGELLADHPRGVEPLGLVVRRHADVDDHEVGRVLTHELEQLGRVARPGRRPSNPDPSSRLREPLAEQDVVVRERYADRGRLHRIETIMRVRAPDVPR